MIIGNIFFFVRKGAITIIITILTLFNLYVRKISKDGHVYLASKIYIFSYLAMWQLSMMFGTGMNSIAFISLVVMVVIAGILLGPQWTMKITVINIIYALIIAMLEVSNHLPPPFFPLPPIVSWFVLLAMFFLMVPPLNLAISNLEKALVLSDERLRERAQAEEDLQVSYETTLQGWANALELRDKETEGHSRRVTDLALLIGAEIDLSYI